MADVFPATRAKIGIGAGDVEAFGADHEPVQADELQAFGVHDVAVLAALVRGDIGGPFRECERSDFDAGVARLSNDLARLSERASFERFVANGMAELIGHELLSVTRGLRALCSQSADTYGERIVLVRDSERPDDRSHGLFCGEN